MLYFKSEHFKKSNITNLKKMKNIIQIFTILLSLGLSELNAQNISGLYMSKEILQAYNNESRNYNGTPGKNYFQNQTDYTIKAEFFPDTKVLKGSEIITFKNNSNDTLSELYFNLFQNFYKQGTAKDFDIHSKNIHQGVKIKSIKVNGTLIDSSEFWFRSTIFNIPLVNKILPRSTSSLEIEWEQEMPKFKVKRQGTYNKNNFFIAYWYPKLCVYDDIEGWNAIGHKGGAEFYSDYGNFEVEITAPRDYTVWSSGYLNNISDIFNEKFIKRINEAKQTNKNIQIITESDRKENQITKPKAKHTWKYTLNNQTDFAFALSNQYLWDATSTVVDNKRVFVSSAYESTAKNCQKINEISSKSIQYYSYKIPNVIYPDSQLTVFQGGPGGMEFPCIINQQDFENEFETKLVTTHEIGHIYFPFLVGTNEQKYGWMDEGLVSLIGGFDFSIQLGDSAYNMFLSLINSKYKEQATTQICDIPIMIVSHNLGEMTNGFITYQKAITAFYVL